MIFVFRINGYRHDTILKRFTKLHTFLKQLLSMFLNDVKVISHAVSILIININPQYERGKRSLKFKYELQNHEDSLSFNVKELKK